MTYDGIIQSVQSVLTEAEKGEVEGVAIVAIMAGDGYGSTFHGKIGTHLKLLGAIDMLKRRIEADLRDKLLRGDT